MDAQLTDLLRQMCHVQLATIVLTAGLFGYAIYATVTLARILREMRGTQR